MDKVKNPYDRVNRNGFTIANPFITDTMHLKIVNMDELTDEQKAMPKQDHDYTFIKQPQFEKFFVFHWCEYKKNAVKDDDSTAFQTLGERVFFVDYQSAQDYFKLLFDTEFIEYVCFQYEKGEKTGHLHLQGFMRYKTPQYAKQVRKIFPTMSLNPCGNQSNAYCREYCMKDHTRQDGFDFFEHGNFAKNGERLDLKMLIQDLKDGLTYGELLDKYPYQMLNMGDKIEKTRQNIIRERYQNVERTIHATYIYGKEGTGKTTFANRVLGYEYKDVFKVSNYKHSGKYDNYKCQDVILFDEFHGQIELTEMNDMLNGQPYDFGCRYNDKVACFTKAIFTSNYPLAEQYLDERAKGKEPSYKGFVRRIKEIIYMPEQNHYIWQLGQPTAEVLAKLDEQGATYRIDSPIEQIEMKGVQNG